MHKTYSYRLYLLLVVLLCGHGVSAQIWSWARGADGRGLDTRAVATDQSGNVFVAGDDYKSAGWSGGTANFGGGITLPFPTDSERVFWVKYDKAGNPLWAGCTTIGNPTLCNITTDPCGNLIVYGFFTSVTLQIGSFTLTNTSHRMTDYEIASYFLIKISPSGTILWAINDGSVFPLSNGLPMYDNKLSGGGVATDDSANIYITGSFFDTAMHIGPFVLPNVLLPGGGMALNVFVARYSPSGTVVWASSFGGAYHEFSHAIVALPNGNVYVTGEFGSASFNIGPSIISSPLGVASPSRFYGYLAQFSAATGTALWGQGFGINWGAYGNGLDKDANGNFYLAGGTYDTAVTLGGETLHRTFLSSDSMPIAFVARYSPANVVTWARTIGSPTQEVTGYSVAVQPDGSKVWISGSYLGNAVLQPGDTMPIVPPMGIPLLQDDQSFVVGYDTAGSVAAYTGFSSGGWCQNQVACDAAGNAFFCGFYEGYDNPASTTFHMGANSITSSGGGSDNVAYMFLGKFGDAPVPADTVYTSRDTAACDSITMMLTGDAGYVSYLWNDGSTSFTDTVSTSGTYYVINSSCSSRFRVDTFHVKIGTKDTVSFHIDSSFCMVPGLHPSILGPPGYNNYFWNTGDTLRLMTVSNPGTYWLNATSGCGMAKDTFSVAFAPIPVVALGTDTFLCAGNSITLFASQPATSKYLWSTGSTATSIIVSSAGAYWLSITDAAGCTASDTIGVTLLTPSVTAQLTNVTLSETIAYGSSVQLNADNAVIYTWKPDNGSLSNPNINNPVATPANTTVYTVYGYDTQGCFDSASVTIYVDSTMNECIPSAFTPNGDGLNDIFEPSCIKFQKLVDFRIYNRWGQQVFYSNDYKKGWDGTFNGVPQDMGIFYYYIIVAKPGGNDVIYKGDVTLIR